MALSFGGLVAFSIVAPGTSGFADFGLDPTLARAHSIQDQWLLSMKLPFNTIYVNTICVYIRDWNTEGVCGLYLLSIFEQCGRRFCR